jgi:O-antigen/teichoic acid export membrane protein
MTNSTSIRRFILGGAFSSLVAILLVKSMGFAESVLVARIIGASGFGLLALVLSLTNIMIAVASMGIPSAVTKFLSGEVSRSGEGSRGTLYSAVRMTAFSSAAVSIAAGSIGFFLIAPYYANNTLRDMLLISVVLVGLTTPILSFASALQGMGKVIHLNLVSIAAAGIGLLLAVTLAIAFAEKGALIAFLVGAAMPGLLAVRFVRAGLRDLPNTGQTSGVRRKDMLNYGLPTLLAGLSVLAALYVMNSWLAVESGFTDLGNLAVAASLAAVIGLIPSAMGIPLVPALSSLHVSDPTRGQSLVPRAMRITAFLSVPVVVIVITFSQEIIGLAYGPQFTGASQLLAILATSSLIASICGVIGSQISGAGKMWLGLETNLLWVAALISSSAVLIPKLGALGASLATLISYSVLGLALIVMGTWKLSLRFSGVVIPVAWSLAFVGGALSLEFLGGNVRVQAGVLLTALSIISAWILLNGYERETVRDALALFGLQRRSL